MEDTLMQQFVDNFWWRRMWIVIIILGTLISTVTFYKVQDWLNRPS